MRVALVSMRNLPAWEVDDAPLIAALDGMGVSLDRPAWSDPAVDWDQYEGILVRTPWDYQDHRQAFVAWAEARGGRLFNPGAVVRWNTDKRYLRALEQHGVRLAPTEWVAQGETVDLAELIAQRGWTRGFLKPVIGASSSDTLRFNADEQGIVEAQQFLDATSPRVGMMVQPYLDAVEREGELSVIFIDGQPTHAVRKVPVPGDYRVQDDHGASDHGAQASPAELEACRHALAGMHACLPELEGRPLLYARVDLLNDGGGVPCLNELEVVEPSLFFRHGAHAAGMLAEAFTGRVRELSGA